MKKLLIVLLALTVLGALVVAEDAPESSFSVGGWGRMFFMPLQMNVDPLTGTAADDPITAMGPNWGGTGRVGVNFSGTSENIGFNLNIDSNGNTLGVGDQAKIWAKLSPMIKIQLGKIQGDVLRGKLDDLGDILGDCPGKDAVFARFYPKTGMLIDITPVEGFYLGAALDASSTTAGTTTYDYATIDPLADYTIDPSTGVIDQYASVTTPATTATASDMFKSIQVGAGYTIPNVGMFRAQYIGAPDSNEAMAQIAFAYTGVEGLTPDIGITIPFSGDYQWSAVAGTYYNKDAISAYGRIDTTFLGDADISGDKLTVGFDGYFYYTVAAPLSVGVEAWYRGMSPVDSDYDAKVLDLFPAVKLAYSKGYLKVGFDASIGLDDQDMGYAIPIQIEYGF